MGGAVNFDTRWNRDVSYGVPAFCDEPGCNVIDCGLAHVCCNQQPYGGDDGCGLFFCPKHLGTTCTRDGYQAKPDHSDWIKRKEPDPSWAEWRKERNAQNR